MIKPSDNKSYGLLKPFTHITFLNLHHNPTRQMMT